MKIKKLIYIIIQKNEYNNLITNFYFKYRNFTVITDNKQ